MKTKLFFFFGVLCLALIAYDFRLRSYLWNVIMDGTSGNRVKYMALRDVFIERYGDENLYQLTNIHGIIGVSILLGFISMVFFYLTLTPYEKIRNKNKVIILKKIMLIALLVSAAIITFLNLLNLL